MYIIGTKNNLISSSASSTELVGRGMYPLFVGITRAKDNLEISYYTSPDDVRVLSGPSSYISMIPRNLTSFEDTDLSIADLQSIGERLI
jgi:DNA helicase-2/ATP-dependent DNA helicase PcrA